MEGEISLQLQKIGGTPGAVDRIRSAPRKKVRSDFRKASGTAKGLDIYMKDFPGMEMEGLI